MRLQLSTDRLILEALLDGRNLAANISCEIDCSRVHVNQRMGMSHEYGHIERAGPSGDIGLYQITPHGVATLELIDEYGSDESEDRVDARAEELEVRRFEIIDHAEPAE